MEFKLKIKIDNPFSAKLAHPALQMLEFFWGSPESMSKCVRLMGSKSDLKYGPPETTLGRNCLQQLVETSSLSLKRQ